jgi:hypothetical protein
LKTGVLFGSMILSLYFALIAGSYILSLLCCLVEVSLPILITLP